MSAADERWRRGGGDNGRSSTRSRPRGSRGSGDHGRPRPTRPSRASTSPAAGRSSARSGRGPDRWPRSRTRHQVTRHRNSNVQHLTPPPALTNSDISTGTGSNPRVRTRSCIPAAATGSTTWWPSLTALSPSEYASASPHADRVREEPLEHAASSAQRTRAGSRRRCARRGRRAPCRGGRSAGRRGGDSRPAGRRTPAARRCALRVVRNPQPASATGPANVTSPWPSQNARAGRTSRKPCSTNHCRYGTCSGARRGGGTAPSAPARRARRRRWR